MNIKKRCLFKVSFLFYTISIMKKGLEGNIMSKQTVFQELKQWYTPLQVIMNHAGMSPYQERTKQDISTLSKEELNTLQKDLQHIRTCLESLYT